MNHSSSSDEAAVSSLYKQLIDAWNRRDAAAYAALFTEDANVVGFDGSQMNGSIEIQQSLQQIFADHITASYVSKIRGVWFLTPETAILRSVAGMVPPGQPDLNPAVNAIQSIVAVRQGSQWRIALFQNTPAQFHGRPDLSEALTEELRQLL